MSPGTPDAEAAKTVVDGCVFNGSTAQPNRLNLKGWMTGCTNGHLYSRGEGLQRDRLHAHPGMVLTER